MKKTILAAAGALVLAATLPVLAQQPKIEIPKDVLYLGLGPTQYLAKTRLIGQTVVDKNGVRIGVVEDIILGTKDDKIDGLIFDSNGKRLGVRITATRIESKDGKITITIPSLTAEMLKATEKSLPAFGAKK